MERKSLNISFLSITAIFTYCLGMTDTHILPKWFYTLSMVAVVGMVGGFALLFKKQGSPREKPLLTIVAVLCSCQAIYGIAQALGLCTSPNVHCKKKDSADGRLLMLRCGWEMIKDKPLLGHGIGSIEAHYMDYQAEWLSQLPIPLSLLWQIM